MHLKLRLLGGNAYISTKSFQIVMDKNTKFHIKISKLYLLVPKEDSDMECYCQSLIMSHK